MNKTKIVDVLNEAGYVTVLEDKIPKIELNVKNNRELSKNVKEIKKICQDHGYFSSIGWKINFSRGEKSEKK